LDTYKRIGGAFYLLLQGRNCTCRIEQGGNRGCDEPMREIGSMIKHVGKLEELVQRNRNLEVLSVVQHYLELFGITLPYWLNGSRLLEEMCCTQLQGSLSRKWITLLRNVGNYLPVGTAKVSGNLYLHSYRSDKLISSKQQFP
jgi:hypothetical protein